MPKTEKAVVSKMAAIRKQARKQLDFKLPLARIRTIMKSSPEVENIGQDSLYLVTKATEMFIHYLATEAMKEGKNKHTVNIDYKNLAKTVQSNEILAFLREIMPQKITFKQYKEIMKKKGITDVYKSDSENEESFDSLSHVHR